MEPWDSSSPSSHPTQSPSPLPKLTYSAKVKEHRTLTHPLCLKYWRFDLSFNKEKNHHCMPSMAKTIMLYQSLKSYQSFHDPQLEGKGFTKSTLSNCIRSFDYLCVNRLRWHIS